jgi:hypothetical protein
LGEEKIMPEVMVLYMHVWETVVPVHPWWHVVIPLVRYGRSIVG